MTNLKDMIRIYTADILSEQHDFHVNTPEQIKEYEDWKAGKLDDLMDEITTRLIGGNNG